MSFASNRNSFSGEYKKKGFFQAEYNEIFLDSIISIIQQHFASHLAQSAQKPLRVLSIGAGCGNTEYSFQQKLLKAGFNPVIDATDISESQIKVAKETYENSTLQFKVESAEALQDKNKYDLIICLFAFHWFDDKAKVAGKIKSALTQNGLFFALIPLEKPQLFSLRQKNVDFWKPYLDNFQLKPLVGDPEIYQGIFMGQFEFMQSQYQRNVHEFSQTKFQGFVSGWIPELRVKKSRTRSGEPMEALAPAQKKSLLNDLTTSIPEHKEDNDIGIDNQDIINFGERIWVVACSNQSFDFTLTAPNVDETSETSFNIKRFV